VPDGTVGELIVRTDEPWCLTPGYLGMPEATASAWRNGWFHTGDGFKRVDGWYYFVDRMKDAIRRRGENISSFEVEAAVVRHPSVRECAAVAYPIPGEEDEVRLFIVPTSPDFDPDALYGFLCEHMPRFMLPRFIETIDELPRTEASGRLRKVVLRERPLPDGVWDREVRFGRTA
jgi:crotonobetaine/carnitine-CoA ligase